MSEDKPPIIIEPTDGFVDASQTVTTPGTPAEAETGVGAGGSPAGYVTLEAVKEVLASLTPPENPDEWRSTARRLTGMAS